MQAIEGQAPVIADHEVVPDIESRERTLAGIQEVNLFPVSGTVVERLCVRIAGEKFDIFDVLAQAQLQRVVAGVSIGNEVAVAAEARSKGSTGTVISPPVIGW